jgi:large subunit ribosomal protein L24
MSKKFHVKKGDYVVVISGTHKGKSGEISKVFTTENRVIVKGVNVVKRHMRPTPANPNGVLEKELSLHISNVAHIDAETKKPSKVGVKISAAGKKVRFLKSSGKELN